MNKSSIASLASLKTGTSFESETLTFYTDHTHAYQLSHIDELREKGAFNDTLLFIGSIKRDQTLALREIEEIINTQTKSTYPVIEQFRETPSYRAGVRGADNALALINTADDTESSMFVDDIIQFESDYASAFDEYTFYQRRMKSKISDEELEDRHTECKQILHDLEAAKLSLIEHIEAVVNPYNIKDAVQYASIIRSLYRILTSNLTLVHSDQFDEVQTTQEHS
ncbi:MAG: hypothetical protein OCC49_18215 [Fibrobacterales bacterium]